MGGEVSSWKGDVSVSFPFSTIMNEIDEDKLWSYLSFDIHLDTLMEMWVKLGGIDDPNQLGVADHMISHYGPEAILKLLTPDIIPKLVSADEDERKEARELMEQMGVT